MYLGELTQERQPLPHVIGFPNLKVLPADLTPDGTSSLTYFVRLAKLYGILADAAGSPTFTHNLLLTCYRFKPRRPFLCSLKRKVPAAFPMPTYGSAISYDRNFGTNPFTLLWPVNSPVYASQHLFCISASACCARLGSRLRVKLYRGGHFSPLNCARLAARVSFRRDGLH